MALRGVVDTAVRDHALLDQATPQRPVAVRRAAAGQPAGHGACVVSSELPLRVFRAAGDAVPAAADRIL